jgi:MFS family permease
MVFALFFVVPRMRGIHFGRPVLIAFAGFLLSQILLVCAPPNGIAALLVSTLLEGASYAVLGTQVDRLTVINVDARERARIVSIAHVLVIACTAPFGWIAGVLSERSPVNPFLLNMALIVIGIVLVQCLRQTDSDVAAAPSEA